MNPNNQPQPDTDQILHYLTSAARSIVKGVDTGYSAEGKRTITHIYNWLRSDLMDGNLAEYESSYDYCLQKYPDEACELYDTMYEIAGLGIHGTYEEFMAKCTESVVGEGFGDTIKRGIKSVKRGMQGWGNNMPGGGPKDIVKRNKSYTDSTIKDLSQYDRPAGSTEKYPEHSPRGLQQRVVNREMKKRGLGEDASCGATSAGAFATGAVGAAKPKKVAKRKSAIGEGIDQVDEGYWDEAMKKFEKGQTKRKANPNEKFEKNPASHDKDGIYKGDKDLDGKPVRKTNTGK